MLIIVLYMERESCAIIYW